MKVVILVAGSRTYTDYENFQAVMDYELGSNQGGIVIVEGGAVGVDSMARDYAKEHGIEFVEFRPDWQRYGRAAGPKRNDAMVDYVKENNGAALYFWDGKSKGTKQCIESARKQGLPVRVWDTVNGGFME